MDDTNTYGYTDNRSRFRKWWDAKTIQRFPEGAYDTDLIALGGVRFGWLDRLLVLCGRDLRIEVRSKQPPIDVVLHVRTEPRRQSPL